MLPMIAIAVLACVVGYYIKNKFCKVDEDEENKKEKDLQRDLEKMRFPAPKANKPWLNMPPTNSQFKISMLMILTLFRRLPWSSRRLRVYSPWLPDIQRQENQFKRVWQSMKCS